ncbi:MAG: aromatic amino acid ammonia-lyase [Actinomycetota bacterium]|nr:aromatic amino acid ammonia-lyase [Actinomycetota bacterium]
MGGANLNVVTVAGSTLHIDELLDVANGAKVELSSTAVESLQSSRTVVDRALSSGRPVYGLNTGLGHMSNVRLPDEQLLPFQEMMLAAHAGGFGRDLPTTIVRAAMMARVNGMARGGSGVSPAAVDSLVGMLNAGVHPVVPTLGSVGAGDLAQLAHVALVAIGKGRAEYDGIVVEGEEALRRAGIPPLVLAPKDALSLMSANAVSIGHGAFVVTRAAEVAELADLAAAVSLESIGGNPSIVHAFVAASKPVPGQAETSRHIRALTEGSYLYDPDGPESIQDALSFRVVPQVHGAVREFIALTRNSVEIELNSRSDNPLVFEAQDTMIHNGNFHPMMMALAFDALRPALAHIGQLSERRMSHLWDAVFADPDFAPEGPDGAPRDFFGLALRYSAAQVFAQLKQLASPATLDCPPLDIGVEDHATSAPSSVARTEDALDLLADILAIEILMARDLLHLSRSARRLGAGTRSALGVIDRALGDLPTSRSAADAHAALRQVLAGTSLG